MAVNETTLKLADNLRIFVDNTVDEQTRDLVQAWGRSWDTLSKDWDASLAELTSGDRWPSQTQIRKSRRTLAALSATEEALGRLTTQAGIRVTGDLDGLTRTAARAQAGLIGSQMPGGPDDLLQVSQIYNKVDERALAAIVNRSTQNVTKLAKPIGPTAYARILNDLVKGVVIGENPRDAARRMLGRIDNGFHYGLHRMNIIARTEMLDATRFSSQEQWKANSDVLEGWQWSAELDDRTCPGCWSMHGEIFSLDTPGPEDHQQGRCAGLPATRSWKDLGFDIEEPESILPDAEETFNALPEATKLEIMGPGRLTALNQGEIGWKDLSTYKTNPDWRGSYIATPVSALGA